MSDELQSKLNRRQNINEGTEEGGHKREIFNPYTEFPEFSRKEIKDFEKTFKTYDTSKDGFIDLMELKYMMEKLGEPQTHVSLKQMLAEIDDDKDEKISFREFLMIFRKAARNELMAAGLVSISQKSVDVSEEGVGGAKSFFEAKANEQTMSKKFEEEIKAEQAANKIKSQEAAARKADFKSKMSAFN